MHNTANNTVLQATINHNFLLCQVGWFKWW